ncbi:MAG: hypothetical protein IJ057_03160 [Bacteroidales bacterium]|nr:hypothetical protein [Bacteroidales bacterium]
MGKHTHFTGIGFWVALLALLAGCNHPVETRFIASPQLQAIDSLMWRQPDSASIPANAALASLPYLSICCASLLPQ